MMRPTVAIPSAAPDASVRVQVPALGAGRATDAASTAFRARLGLPTDRPIIMSGHQAEWWHPGILAKLIAARTLADRIGGVVVWVVVDQDDNDPGVVPVPVRRDAGTVVIEDHRFAPESHVATGWRPAMADFAMPERSRVGAPSVLEGLDRVAAAMRARRAEPSVARQVGRAALDIASEFARADHVVFASEFSRTDAWAEFVARMASDPSACMAAYNSAAAAVGAEHVRALDADPARHRWELPIWSIDGAGARTRVWSDAGALRDPASVVPRALAMTALVRAVGCDAFIHGLGGWDYDAVTDAWIAAWLGRPLAPTGLATASLYLRFDGLGRADRSARDAAAQAHKARHDPGALGDAAGRARKDALVARIVADRAAGRSGRDGYLALHAYLAGYRAAHATELEAAAGRAGAAREAYRRSRRAILARHWPFPWHDRPTLAALADAVRDATLRSLEGSPVGA